MHSHLPLRLRTPCRWSKETPARAAAHLKRLTREMASWWKRATREAAVRKVADERAAVEAAKRAEDEREQRRQQQRLNFLLTQARFAT